MTLWSTLPIIPILIVLLWPMVPVAQRPRWVDFMPTTALALLLLDVIIDGYQPLLLGVYAFALIVFLVTLGRLRPTAPKAIKHRVWAGLGGVLATILLAVCVVPPTLIPIRYTPPEPTGPYGLGVVTYGWEDPSRLEPYSPDPNAHRRIAVELWYPTDNRQPGARGVADAPISTKQRSYPLVVFSHGMTGLRASNMSTYKELASRGYIVAAIDHTYLSFYTRFPDGKSVMISQQYLNEVLRLTSSSASPAEDFQITGKWMDLRTGDMRLTLDKIAELNSGAEPGPLAGHVDMSHIGLTGHSMGGATAAATCRQDARCTSALVIDGSLFGEYDRVKQDGTLISDPFPRPLMLVYNADFYKTEPGRQSYSTDINVFEHAAAPVYSVMVQGAGHLNFTDLPGRAPLVINLMGVAIKTNDTKPGTIEPFRCTEILNSYVTAFFDQTLKGEAAPLLTGQPPYREVEIAKHVAQR
ncbi:MAG: hypothetical protein WCI67_13915 [Chloroflexales bacterium]